MSLVIKAPLGSQSFGQVSLNLLREIFSIRDDVCFFAEGQYKGGQELAAFDVEKSFLDKLNAAYARRFMFDPKRDTCIRLWHINGAETRLCNREILYTYHETSELTSLEKRILSFQDKVAVSSSYSQSVFSKHGVTSYVVNPGFDPDLKIIQRKYFPNHIHFGIMGKFEKRKHTAKTIGLWAKKYGNDSRFKLTCAVFNPFLSQEQNDVAFDRALDGKKYNNIFKIPYMPKNSMMNDFLCSLDIDLTGLSGGEGWNLPAFNATALGKWSIVLNATAHKDWATSDNSILVEPSGEIPCEDGVFFKNGLPFNQGNFFDYSEESFYSATNLAISKAKVNNVSGLSLQTEKSYKKSATQLLDLI